MLVLFEKEKSNLFKRSLEIIRTLKKQSIEQVNFYVDSKKEANKGCEHRALSRRVGSRGNYEILNSTNSIWCLGSQVEARCRQMDIVAWCIQLFQRLDLAYTRECEKCYFTHACFSS